MGRREGLNSARFRRLFNFKAHFVSVISITLLYSFPGRAPVSSFRVVTCEAVIRSRNESILEREASICEAVRKGRTE